MVVRIEQGHVLDVLAGMPEQSVHVVVTSPPYWGLRAYGTPPQIWGAAEGCEHAWGDPISDKKRGADAGPSAQVRNTVKRVCPPETQQGAFCARCQAWRGELGSEPTLDLFVSHLVTVFEAVKRVMRDDATLWVNLGDSYAGGGGGNYGEGKSIVGREGVHHTNVKNRDGFLTANGLKPGDLCMAPARFALAMQAAGWCLRSEITLCKTAPMPESVQGARWERCRVAVRPSGRSAEASKGASPAGRQSATLRGGDAYEPGAPSREAARATMAAWADCPGCAKCSQTDGYVQRWGSGRPTSAVEKLFLFAKAGKRYFYDLDAVRVPQAGYEYAGRSGISAEGYEDKPKTETGGKRQNVLTQHRDYHPAGRNTWNYVMWSPEPLAAAHYAAFPRFIPRLAIQAGTSERGVCPTCGSPWLRIVEKRYVKSPVHGEGSVVGRHYETGSNGWDGAGYPRVNAESTTLGWRQSCACAPHEPSPSTVMDIFSGSGTTVIEANALGRHGIGIELQEKYVAIAHKRLSGQPLSLFAHEGAAEFEGGEAPAALEATKQEGHPNRTVLGLPPLVKARDGAVGMEAEAAG